MRFNYNSHMFINRSDISTLKQLSFSRELVPITNIPESFKSDFNKFFFGKTLVKENDQIFAYPHDIKHWVRYVFLKYKD